MARKPEVFVRALSNEEGQRLVRITRTTTNRVRLRRAMIVLASAQGQSVPQIAHLTQGDEGYIRQVIKDDPFHVSANTDPKGDRSRRPQEQDPDVLLHVVGETDNGIIVDTATDVQHAMDRGYGDEGFARLAAS
jgi:aromatic ring hydroxylase